MSYYPNPINKSFDFTGTQYNTKAKCNAAGIYFHDDGGYYPTSFGIAGFTVQSGTWTHSAGNGWIASSIGESQNADFIIRLTKQNFQVDLEFDYEESGAANERGYMRICCITDSNHIGFGGQAYDENDDAGAPQLVWNLWTNDGDDTLTNKYTGAALAGTGVRYLKVKSVNGVISIYDDQNDSWNDYEGHQDVGRSYTYNYVGFFNYKTAAKALAPIYIRKIDITYINNNEL